MLDFLVPCSYVTVQDINFGYLMNTLTRDVDRTFSVVKGDTTNLMRIVENGLELYES